jgi:glycosyltransferase involved in cell wall biosynthesis
MAVLAVDATTVFPEGKGISRVVSRSIAALADLPVPHELVAFVRGTAAEAMLSREGVRCVRVGSWPAIVWEQVLLPWAVARHRADAVLTTTDRLPVVGPGRYIVWLYEVPTHRIEETRRVGVGLYQRTSDLLTLALWQRSLRRASRVLAGSQATADDIAARATTRTAPVSVVYPGLDATFRPQSVAAVSRYVFHLGSADPRDNTLTAVEAYALARPGLHEPARLVVAGGLGAQRDRVVARIAELGVTDEVDVLGRVSDEQLVELYAGAAAYLDASLYEGFGYQVLEAMACGAPVVGPHVTSVPEIVGDAGLLCDPRSAGELAAALTRGLDDAELAATLRERGVRRAADFTWERTARALAAVFEEVVANG